MFEHIVLRRSEDGLPISAGRIAEALLYYQRVHLFIDRGALFSLTKQIGLDRLLTLLRRPEVSAVYCEEMLGTKTDSAGVSKYHNFVEITFSGHEKTGELKTPEERLRFELERQGSSKQDAKKFAQSFLRIAPLRRFSGNHYQNGGVAKTAKNDLLDTNYSVQAIRKVVAALPGGYQIGDNFQFEIIQSELGVFVFTNIDFDSINRRRAEAFPSLGPVNIAHLLNNFLEARADLGPVHI